MTNNCHAVYATDICLTERGSLRRAGLRIENVGDASAHVNIENNCIGSNSSATVSSDVTYIHDFIVVLKCLQIGEVELVHR